MGSKDRKRWKQAKKRGTNGKNQKSTEKMMERKKIAEMDDKGGKRRKKWKGTEMDAKQQQKELKIWKESK